MWIATPLAATKVNVSRGGEPADIDTVDKIDNMA
jgi:hypothetical protein